MILCPSLVSLLCFLYYNLKYEVYWIGFPIGTSFLYTTHGWTLISAVVEKVTAKPFPQYMKSLFHELGLRNTYLDENKPLIYNRAKYMNIIMLYFFLFA